MQDIIFTGDGKIGEEIEKILDAQKKGVDLFNSFQKKQIGCTEFEVCFPNSGENFFETCIESAGKIAEQAKKRLDAIRAAG